MHRGRTVKERVNVLSRVSLLALFGLTCALAGPAPSARAFEDKGKKEVAKEDTKRAKVTPAAKAVQNLQMAIQLADYGRENKLPEALITAARVIGTTPLRKVESKLPKGLQPFDQEKEAERLIAEALRLGGGNPVIKKLAAQARSAISERPRGAEGGAKVYEGFVPPGGSRSYQINFEIGALATITVRTLTPTDLDLYVMCNRSGWTTSDRRPNFDCFVSFTVGTVSTDGFTVRVVNADTSRGGRYILFTN
jgi:hypothetical protein